MHRGQAVASVNLVSLEVFNQAGQLPPDLIKMIEAQQPALLAKWTVLNP